MASFWENLELKPVNETALSSYPCSSISCFPWQSRFTLLANKTNHQGTELIHKDTLLWRQLFLRRSNATYGYALITLLSSRSLNGKNTEFTDFAPRRWHNPDVHQALGTTVWVYLYGVNEKHVERNTQKLKALSNQALEMWTKHDRDNRNKSQVSKAEGGNSPKYSKSFPWWFSHRYRYLGNDSHIPMNMMLKCQSENSSLWVCPSEELGDFQFFLVQYMYKNSA